jgi:hypothetical protein
MLPWAINLHPILTVMLLALYAVLVYRFLFMKLEELAAIDTVLIQSARFILLALYLTGLVMSINLGRWVSSWHHTLSLIPVAVLFFFQFLPSVRQKLLTIRTFGWMFLLLFLVVITISLSAKIG